MHEVLVDETAPESSDRVIFTAEQARLILAGRKSQTRRLAVALPDLLAPALGMSDTQLLQTTRHRVGTVYPLERFARGEELTPDQRIRLDERPPINPLSGRRRKRPARPVLPIAHLEITDLRLQELGEIDLKDARAEGFRTTDEFKIDWVERRDRRWATTPLHDPTLDASYRATAGADPQKLESAPRLPEAPEMTERFEERHARALVWAMSFKVVEAPRLLRAAAGFDDYTETPSRAARAEPEAITDEQLQRLTKYSTAKDDARKRKPLATLGDSVSREVDEISNRIAEEGLDDRSTRKTLRALQYHAEELNRKLAS